MSHGTHLRTTNARDAATVTVSGPPGPLAPWPRAVIGRYAVLEELGRGGMGIVVRAYDSKLHREVALKVVRVASTEAEARMVREARAMAQLADPNVVGLFDVTIDEDTTGQVVLVMEYVPGVTLQKWLADEDRSPTAIIDAFVQAGRGLAAAHRAGLLHRDFKPANVLVGDDGRVRVTDFGLARIRWDDTSGSDGSGPVVDDSALTQAGTAMGTPRYMAPEQHRGDRLDAAADQYGFCVALFEALAGHAPFSGEDLAEDKLAGPPSWPTDRPVPARVQSAVLRGLSPDPAARHPSMDDLLAALVPPDRSLRTAWALVGVALVTAGATLWVAEPGASPCLGAEARLADAWNEARAARARAAIAATEVVYAGEVWDRIAPQLDAWAQQWVATHTEACEATQRGEQSEAMLDLRMRCLDRARHRLDATASALEHAAPKTVARAHNLVAGLPELSRCDDLEALQSSVPPPDASEAEAVDAIRAGLAEVATQRAAGNYTEADEAVRRLEAEAAALDYEPIRTEVWLQVGRLHDVLGRYDEAGVALRRVQKTGARLQQWELVAEATARLIHVVGTRLGRPDDALVLRELALGLAAGRPRDEAIVRGHLGSALEHQGKYAQAEAEHRAAYELLREALPPEHPDIASVRVRLGMTLEQQGRYEEAELELRGAIEQGTRAYGDRHPYVALWRTNLAALLSDRGKYEEAVSEYRASIERIVDALGEEHPQVAGVRHNLGIALERNGEHEVAEIEYRAALEQLVANLGPEHENVAVVHNSLGGLLTRQGKLAEAEIEHRAALAGWSALFPPDHPDVLLSRGNLATVLHFQGRLDEAITELREVLAARLRVLPADSPDIGVAHAGLGAALFDAGELVEAEAELRAALKSRLDSFGAEHVETASCRVGLGEALVALGRYEEAEAELRVALQVYEGLLGSDDARMLSALVSMADVLALTGRGDQARTRLERAWTLVETNPGSARRRGRVAFALAKLLVDDADTGARALSLAAEAKTAYAEANLPDRQAEVDAWRVEHRATAQ